MIRGLTLPNRQWELYTKEEEDAILDLHPTGILVLAYPGSTVQGWKTIQDAALWRELGKPEFLLRPYADNIVNWEPEEWIEECLRMVLGYEQEGVKVGGLIPANEMNIEGWGEDVGRIASWLMRAAIQADMRRPDIPLHFPALSPTGRYWDILSGLYTSESRADGFSVVDAHIYSYDQLWDIPRLNTLFQKPICITEYNRMMPSAVMYSQLLKIGKVTGAYWFILSGE